MLLVFNSFLFAPFVTLKRKHRDALAHIVADMVQHLGACVATNCPLFALCEPFRALAKSCTHRLLLASSYDKGSTPDDEESDSDVCGGCDHGHCNTDTKKCKCEGPWVGDHCDKRMHYSRRPPAPFSHLFSACRAFAPVSREGEVICQAIYARACVSRARTLTKLHPALDLTRTNVNGPPPPPARPISLLRALSSNNSPSSQFRE